MEVSDIKILVKSLLCVKHCAKCHILYTIKFSLETVWDRLCISFTDKETEAHKS